jgi:Yip1 domain
MVEPIPFPESPRPIHARMGFLDLVFGTLFQPIKTFRQVSGPNTHSSGIFISAICCIALVSISGAIISQIVSHGDVGALAFLIPLKIVIELVKWLWFGGIVGITAYIFYGKAHYETFLKLSGLAVLPELLLSPVVLISQSMHPGTLEAAFSSLFLGFAIFMIWVWTSLLFVLALIEAYTMSAPRAFLFFLLPIMLIMSLFGGITEMIGELIRLGIQGS